jgi:hypothetical protein
VRRPFAALLLLAVLIVAGLLVVLFLRPGSGVRPPGVLPADPFAGSADPVLVGAGDIADCGLDADSRTADLLDVVAGTVFAAGDNAYQSGTAAEYERCFGPTWGRHRDRIRPAVGNHEYQTPEAAGYRAYWGDTAGSAEGFWYSFELGAWHLVVLDSNCSIVGCASGSAQLAWLQADLAASDALCTAAIWHHPRFSSGDHGDAHDVGPLWDALVADGAEIVLSGHDHDYERFVPTDGMRQFVVGTGGAALRGFGTPRRGSEVRNAVTHGVLALRLRPSGYDWHFVPIAGATFSDTGSEACRQV